MDKAYNHKKYETEIYEKWEESGAFKASGEGRPYTVLMPPPNANASLHAGHVMYTVDDIMVRWKRMQGYSAAWIPGMDHAGFETQFVYEKELAKKGKSRMDFDRETLYKDIFQFVRNNSDLVFRQFKRLGFSADWSRSVFTLDKQVLAAVWETFKKMEAEGKVYRDEYMVNYCHYCGTSLSELEVEHEDRKDKLYFIAYPLADGSGEIVVATVRPETMYGDTAVAVNPKDGRYKNLTGQKVRLPLTGREIPIIADEMVDPEFGTGAVKITPAHDPNDFEAGRRHQLTRIGVINLQAKMVMPPDAEYREPEGKNIKQARELVVNKLLQEGRLQKTEENYQHAVTVCYKCKRDLEPTIMPNWFIRVGELKKPVIKAVEAEEVVFFPKRFKRQMLQWLSVMHDWPISRQIVWGIRIPVWYEVDKEAENLQVWWLDKSRNLQQGQVCQFLQAGTPLADIEAGLQKVSALTGKTAPKYVVAVNKPGDNYLPETDTFDTWFSSGQWPLVTLGDEEKVRLPTDFMGTLADILPFWISRMLMFTLYLRNKIPFKNVYLWSMVADAKGVKMSKSRGNVVNPIEWVDKYGADAIRMSLLYGTPAGSKVILAEEKVRGMRNFSNKIWNAGRYILSVPLPQDTEKISEPRLESKMKEISKKVTGFLTKFQLSYAADYLYENFWHWFCDEEIEKAKKGEVSKADLAGGLIIFLKLLHPFMPLVTEAVWGELKQENMLISSAWPEPGY